MTKKKPAVKPVCKPKPVPAGASFKGGKKA